MIAKQTIKQLTKTAAIRNKTRNTNEVTMTFKLANHFSTKFYDGIKAAPYRSHIFKSSNLKYKSKDMFMLPYFYHPSIEKSLLIPCYQNTQYYQIKNSSVMNLNFLIETTDDLAQSAWESRKTIALGFREALKIMKISPQSNKSQYIEQFFTNQSDPNYRPMKKTLNITDKSEKGEVEFILSQFSLSSFSQQYELTWQTNFAISYEDYSSFLKSIQSNILFISGVKFSLQLTKEQSIISASNALFQMFQVSKQQKATSKPTPTPTKSKYPKKIV